MVTVIFVRDYSGPHTSGAYLYGEQVSLSPEQAAGLLAEGAAEMVAADVPTPPESAPVATPPVTGDARMEPTLTLRPAPSARKRASKKAAKS